MIEVRRSSIHGYGVFSLVHVPYGSVIINPWFSKCAGWRKFRGFNRSCHPNGVVEPIDAEVRAVRHITPGEEITLGYLIPVCRCQTCKK